MKALGLLTVIAVLGAWLVWNTWSLFRLVTGVRDGSWWRPMWWTRLCSVALFVGVAAWIRGLFATGLDTRKTCLFVHHERYDEAYRQSHATEFSKIFPLHDMCNAHADLVPAWGNPTIAVCGVVALAAAAVLLWFVTRRSSDFSNMQERRPSHALDWSVTPLLHRRHVLGRIPRLIEDRLRGSRRAGSEQISRR